MCPLRSFLTRFCNVNLYLCIVKKIHLGFQMKNSCSSPFRVLIMLSGKRLADIGYRTFTGTMMLLTVYGGYLCVMRGYRYMERQKQLQLAAENQDPEVLKD